MAKGITKLLVDLKDTILDIIYPHKEECIICSEEGFVAACPLCLSKIKRDREDTNIYSYGQYGGVLKKLILSFKYQNNFTVGKVLSKLMIVKIKELDLSLDLILYVPTTKEALRKRGFNQCEYLAKEIAKELDVDCLNCIKRNKHTKEQKRLSMEEREANIKGAFKLTNQELLINKKVLVIDDVITSGATLNECFKILKDIGTESIDLLTIARSRPKLSKNR